MAECLRVVGVDLCYDENGKSHHTSPFDIMQQQSALVIRRGQPFKMFVDLDRPYNPTTDVITLTVVFSFEGKPSFGEGTYVSVPVTKDVPEGTDFWYANLKDTKLNDGKRLIIEVCPAPHVIVGVWNIDIDTQLGKMFQTYGSIQDIYILFNPWCSADQVYLPDEAQRQEYVMADSGKMFKGSASRLQPCGWVFAQFDKDILDCALTLVNDIGWLPNINCNNPIRIARVLSECVNARQTSNRHQGVLMDKRDAVQSDDLDDGTDPNVWSGSKAILQTYYDRWMNRCRSDRFQEPVRYGQCWVFAGVLTTVCRALGLPARPVTAYFAGQDTKGSITVDEFYDNEGKLITGMTEDSIWTYHVFTEVWMKRPDLSSDGCYDGWNYLDATPMKMSDGAYRCGPASVKAVQKGEVYLNYDTEFVIGMVNSEKMYWVYQSPLEPLKMVRSDRSCVGQCISTKAVGSYEREDITATYKVEKGNDCKLSAFRKQHMSNNDYCPDTDDFKVTLKFEDDVVIGSDFKISAVFTNARVVDIHISVDLRVETTTYYGKVGKLIKDLQREIVVPKSSTYDVGLNIEHIEYWGKLINQCNFNVVCFAKIKEIGQLYIAKDTYRLRKPDLKFEIQGTPTVDTPFTLAASVVNPLPKIPLYNATFHFQGAGMDLSNEVNPDLRSVGPGEEVKVVNEITPRKPGLSFVGVKFFSSELADVEGFVEFHVK